MSYWQTSDNVPAAVIQGFTKDCPREDCRISARTLETTLAGVSDHYLKDGTHVIEDNNRFTAELCCARCWKEAVVNDHGEIVNLRHKAKF